MSGCCRLAELSVSSPTLTELRAVACPCLRRLVLNPASLNRLLLTNCEALREVVLTVPTGGEGEGLQGSGEGGAGTGSNRAGRAGSGRGLGAVLALSGCSALPEAVKERLRDVMMRARSHAVPRE